MIETCIETIKALDGEIYHIDYHQKRYESTLKYFYGIVNEICKLQEYLHPPKNGLYRCRVVYSHRGIIDVSYHPYKKREINKLKIIINNDITYKYKSTDRELLNKAYELREEADDVIIVKNGYITDTTIANIALQKDGIWYTPQTPLLRGTTRQRLLDAGKIKEAKINIKDIKTYSQIALLNSMIDFDIISKRDIKDIIC